MGERDGFDPGGSGFFESSDQFDPGLDRQYLLFTLQAIARSDFDDLD
jgi:hypothetical protein